MYIYIYIYIYIKNKQKKTKITLFTTHFIHKTGQRTTRVTLDTYTFKCLWSIMHQSFETPDPPPSGIPGEFTLFVFEP